MRDHPVYQTEISHISHNQFQAVLGEELVLEYREGRFEMGFKDQKRQVFPQEEEEDMWNWMF